MTSTALQPTAGSHKNPLPLLEKRIELLEHENKTLHRKLLATRRELALLQGKNPQLALDELIAEFERSEAARIERELAEAEPRAPEAETEQPRTPREKKVGHGPRPQPHLPVIETVHELDAEERECKVCGGEMAKMGEQFEETEEITVIERRYAKVVHKRRKYRCSCNACVETAPGPLRLIPGGRYSIDFAIHVAEQKYLDHLPLERQSRIMDRRGLQVTSQTLWDQIRALAEILEPSYAELGRKALKAPVLHADETRWPLLDGKTSSTWTVWARNTAEIAHYAILNSKSTKSARRLFSGFEGILVVDGYAVYEALVRAGPQIRLANCWAHALRKFSDIEENHPKACRTMLRWIRELYDVEGLVPGPFPGDEKAQSLRWTLRQERSGPILEQMKNWMETMIGLPRSDLGRAVKYLLKRWDGFTRFVENPLIPLDNNAAERALRGPVVGRKNHYGSKSKKGTEVAAIFYSLFETAKLCGVDPAAYVKTAAERALRQPGTVTLPQDLLTD